MNLGAKDCVPCRGGTPPLEAGQSRELLLELSDGWEVLDNHHLQKTLRFENFAQALQFVNRVGAIAEEQNHHPDLFLAWGKVTITLWTHKIDGLTESDFIFAAKCDSLR
jgi:4a-hydroxytetrahydrobiopterin dehydratase